MMEEMDLTGQRRNHTLLQASSIEERKPPPFHIEGYSTLKTGVLVLFDIKREVYDLAKLSLV